MDGLFINIEGPDASGKATQAAKLVDRLEENGYAVHFQDFPAYERTEAGRDLYDYLHSDDELPLREEARLFIEDRYALRDELVDALEAGKIVVTDRYAESNWAYQTTGMDPSERWAFIDWMKEQETALPDPDVVIYLDMPVEQSLALIEHRDGPADRNENAEKLRQVVAAYREIAEQEDWTVIDPMKQGWDDHDIDGSDWLRSPESIHEDVWKAVEQHLP